MNYLRRSDLTACNDCKTKQLSASNFLNNFVCGLDNNDINPKVKDSYISISSDEDEINSLTNSSVNLDASDDGELSLEIDG